MADLAACLAVEGNCEQSGNVSSRFRAANDLAERRPVNEGTNVIEVKDENHQRTIVFKNPSSDNGSGQHQSPSGSGSAKSLSSVSGLMEGCYRFAETI
jgi:hypothetical protein